MLGYFRLVFGMNAITGMILLVFCCTGRTVGRARMSRVDLVAFGPGNFLCTYLDRLSPNFDLHVRMSLEIVIPVRVGIGSPLEAKTR